jgi:uncharacterized delta-60 repeat protein
MRPFHPRPGRPTSAPRQGPRMLLRVVVRLLAVVVFAWQLAVAAPAQARPGDPDRSFGMDGKVTTDFAGSGLARALVVQDRKLVAAGVAFSSETGDDFGLARFNANGGLDRRFGTGGKVTTDITPSGSPDEANALIQQADGKLVAAGVAPTQTGSSFALARYNPDGTLDASFGTGGTVTTDFNGGANALVVQVDGRLVAAGQAGEDFGLARYHPNGTLDSTFGTGGTVTTEFAGSSDAAFALAVQADGKLVAAGGTGSAFALARYRTR